MIKFPKPLVPGCTIAVTAPSSGVSGTALGRLDLVLDFLRSQGFAVVEGACLRNQHKDASADATTRARELTSFLLNPEIAAVLPPWGGELATEVLDLIDFEALRAAEPKWVLGYSDLSTLQLPLTLVSHWATAHGPNMMDLAPTQTDKLTTRALSVLAVDWADPVVQHSSSRYEKNFTPYEERVDAPFNLTEQTRWRRLDGASADIKFQGRLIGGCLDTIAWLAGTRYGDISSYTQGNGDTGTILFLENAEMSPAGLVRCLLSLRRQGWFDGLAGLLIGRSAAPDPSSPDRLGYAEALAACLQGLPYPVLVDVDIGHRPPQFTLVNGARADVVFTERGSSITQHSS